MSDTVISVENLGKKYIIGHEKQERYTALRDVIANGAKGLLKPFQRGKDRDLDPTHEEFWALKDVSFEIKQGDRVGDYWAQWGGEIDAVEDFESDYGADGGAD